MKAATNLAVHAKSRGFTLLELMLSMTLTALLLGMLSAGVYAVVNDWQSETSVLDETLDKALVVLQLERALQSAFPHSYIDERFTRRVYFEGSDTKISFVSTVSPQRVVGLTAWQLQSDVDEGLRLTLTPALSDNPSVRLEALQPVALLRNYTARFRYLLQRNNEEKEWIEEWDGTEMQSLPRAVHVVLTPLDANSEEDVLEIVAPIRTWRHREIDPVTQGF
jgi:general secretion pathway protein J